LCALAILSEGAAAQGKNLKSFNKQKRTPALYIDNTSGSPRRACLKKFVKEIIIQSLLLNKKAKINAQTKIP
jgi:hypothetical protein